MPRVPFYRLLAGGLTRLLLFQPDAGIGVVEGLPDSEWISARAEEMVPSLNETAFGVVTLSPLRLGAATEEKPVLALDLFNPVPVVILGNPEGVGHVRLRRSIVDESQPSLGEGAA